MQGCKKVIVTPSVRRPTPHNTNPWEVRKNRKIVEAKKEASSLG